MDNLTHSLVAVALSRAGLQRIVPHATAILLVSANLPDLDVWAIASSQLADLELHRGYTHAFIGLVPQVLLSVLLTGLIFRERLPLLRSSLVALIGLLSHLLLDCTSSFGIRPYLPFSSRWTYFDLNGFYDGVILSTLALAFLWPWFVDLVSSEMGKRLRHRGQGSATAVLLFLSLYEGSRYTLHQRALNQLSSRLYDGQVPIEVSAIGEPNNPFEWIGVIETQDSFRIVKVGSLSIDNSTDARIFRKPTRAAVYKAVMQYEPFRYMAYFARFPVWSIEPIKLTSGAGQRVDLTDLRFGTPGAGEFHASALTDSSDNVLQAHFGFSTRELDQLFIVSSTDR